MRMWVPENPNWKDRRWRSVGLRNFCKVIEPPRGGVGTLTADWSFQTPVHCLCAVQKTWNKSNFSSSWHSLLENIVSALINTLFSTTNFLLVSTVFLEKYFRKYLSCCTLLSWVSTTPRLKYEIPCEHFLLPHTFLFFFFNLNFVS